MEGKNFSFRCISFQEKDNTYTGVCLDLDIVEEGHQTLNEAILSINDAIASHMRAAEKLGFPKELTNRPAPKEYWDKVEESLNARPPRLPLKQLQYYTSSAQAPQYA